MQELFLKEFEDRKVEEILGWKVFRVKGIERVIAEKPKAQIVDCFGKKIYFLHRFPELSFEEANLLIEVLEELKEKEEVQKALLEYCEENFVLLEEEQQKYLNKVLDLSVKGYGALSEILEDEEIEEVSVCGLGKENPVRVYEKNFGWIETNLYYVREETVKNLVNKMARNIGRRITLQNPRLNAVLPTGERIHAAIEPVSQNPSLTIRRFRKKPFTALELEKNRTISLNALAFLYTAMQTDSSVLVAGNTGSGKTTTLNALFSFVPENERIITAEETPELNLMQKHVVKMRIVEGIEIGMNELITDSLRMRPDRIIVGEVRTKEEMEAFIDTLLAGQGKGSYATFHAQSAKEAIQRMKKLGVKEMDLESIDLIVVQRRWTKINKKERKEQRRVTEIAEILEGGKLNMLYEYDFGRDLLAERNESVKVIKKIMNSFSVPKNKTLKIVEKNTNFLEKLSEKDLSAFELFKELNS